MSDRHHPDDPAAIERELRHTRARVDRTIDEIQDRLSPGQLLDEGLRYFRQGPADYLSTFGSNLGQSVRDNPLPVAMIGLGVAWLAFGQQHPGGAQYRASGASPYAGAQRRHAYDQDWHPQESIAERARGAADQLKRHADETEEAFERRRQQAMARILDLEERAGESVSDLQARVASGLHEASVRWEEMSHAVRQRGHDLRDQAGRGVTYARETVGSGLSHGWDSASRTSSRAFELFEEQPLLAAAAGITVGALLGSLFPSTQREKEVLGPPRDALLQRGEAVAQDTVDTMKEAGRAVADAALDEVEHVVDEAERATDDAARTLDKKVEDRTRSDYDTSDTATAKTGSDDPRGSGPAARPL